MASLKIHGSVFSGPTMRAMACLNEKDLPFEFVPVDMQSGEHKKEHYLALNPFGLVPAFENGDLKMFESRAITKYIANAHAEEGTQLLPSDPKNRTDLSVWMEVEAHQFDPVASQLTWEQVLKPIFGMVTDDAVVQENEAKLEKVLDVYEARLAQSKYLACDSFTLADLHHLPNLNYLLNSPTKKLFESRPHVSAWATDITARPAWSKVVAMQKQQ